MRIYFGLSLPLFTAIILNKNHNDDIYSYVYYRYLKREPF